MSPTGWRIDPETLALTNPDATGVYTADEFDAQQWPPCPECGRTVHVDRIAVPEPGQLRMRYMVGEWHCRSALDAAVHRLREGGW